MSSNNEKTAVRNGGINITNITFNANAEVEGLSDDFLDSVSAGLASDIHATNTCGDVPNTKC